MALTNAGRDIIADCIMNDGPPTFYDNSNAHLGVGNSTTAFNVTQTDLIGASKFRKSMEATFPNQTSPNVMQFRSLIGTGDANFQWDEWGTFNASSAGVMLQRKVEVLGTKTAAQQWQLTVDLTVTAA